MYMQRRGFVPWPHLLGGEEKLVGVHELLGKLVTSPDLPDVCKVLLFMVVRRRLASIRVLDALGRLWHLRLHSGNWVAGWWTCPPCTSAAA